MGDGADGVSGMDGGVEGADDGRGWRWEGAEADGDLGDEGEGAFGAGEQSDEVVSGDAFCRLAADRGVLSRSGDDVEGEHVVPGDAVLDAAQSSGVGGNVAPEGGPGGASGIRWIPQSFGGAGGAEVVVDDSGFDDGIAFERVDLLDTVHLLEADDDCTLDSVRRSGQAGARASGDDGNVMVVAGADSALDLLSGGGADQRDGGAVGCPACLITRVGGEHGRIGGGAGRGEGSNHGRGRGGGLQGVRHAMHRDPRPPSTARQTPVM